MRKKEYYKLNKDMLKTQNKLSMIEYKMREYIEKNGNPYTLIRDIINIIRED